MDEVLFYQRQDVLMGCFDQQKSLPLIQKALKRQEGGFWQKWKAGNIAFWYVCASWLSIFGRPGVFLAYPITIIAEPFITLFSVWFWMNPLHRKDTHVAEQAKIVANSVYFWWYYQICEAMKKDKTGELLLDENLVPLGVLYGAGWELSGFSEVERVGFIKIFADGVKSRLADLPNGLEVPDVHYVVTDIFLKKEGDRYILRGVYDTVSEAEREKNAAGFVFSKL